MLPSVSVAKPGRASDGSSRAALSVRVERKPLEHDKHGKASGPYRHDVRRILARIGARRQANATGCDRFPDPSFAGHVPSHRHVRRSPERRTPGRSVGPGRWAHPSRGRMSAVKGSSVPSPSVAMPTPAVPPAVPSVVPPPASMVDALNGADGIGRNADAGGRTEHGRLGPVHRQGADAKHGGCGDSGDGKLAHRVTLLGLSARTAASGRNLHFRSLNGT